MIVVADRLSVRDHRQTEIETAEVCVHFEAKKRVKGLVNFWTPWCDCAVVWLAWSM